MGAPNGWNDNMGGTDSLTKPASKKIDETQKSMAILGFDTLDLRQAREDALMAASERPLASTGLKVRFVVEIYGIMRFETTLISSFFSFLWICM